MQADLTDLQKHLIAKHGFNHDTVDIWTAQELAAQHDWYHKAPSGEDHSHPVSG